jgi:hypothetical protein
MIYINGICFDKFKKNIKRLYSKMKFNDEMILNIYNLILSNYDNLNNIDYLIRKECLSNNKSNKKQRTMKV